MNQAARAVAFGAVIGAVVGLILGLIVHAIFWNDEALVGYEFIGALIGVIFGAGVGAFTGGAVNLRKNRP